MKNWQLWMLVAYVCAAQIASEKFLIGVTVGSVLATIFFAWRDE